jgi:histidinol phosphatase-like PHP family hydrolase
MTKHQEGRRERKRFSILRKLIKCFGVCLLAVIGLVGVLYLTKRTYSYVMRSHLKKCAEIVVGKTTVCDLLDGMHFYEGHLHNHTAYSDGVGTPAQLLFWAKYLIGYDFYAITDHAKYLSVPEWEDTETQVNRFTEEGKFLALRGFEGEIGDTHINVYNTVNFLKPVANWHDFDQWLVANHGLAQLNHPTAQSLDLFTEVTHVNEHFAMIETGNKRRGNISNKYLPVYQKALDQGWMVGPTTNHDTHLPFRELVNSHRTVVIARSLTKNDILEAIKARRFYSSDDPNMKVIFKLEDHWMGSVVTMSGQAVPFTIYIEDDEPITTVEIVSKYGNVVLRKACHTSQVVWEPILPVTEDTFFYVKITEQDRLYDELSSQAQVTVTAPIWIHINK